MGSRSLGGAALRLGGVEMSSVFSLQGTSNYDTWKKTKQRIEGGKDRQRTITSQPRTITHILQHNRRPRPSTNLPISSFSLQHTNREVSTIHVPSTRTDEQTNENIKRPDADHERHEEDVCASGSDAGDDEGVEEKDEGYVHDLFIICTRQTRLSWHESSESIPRTYRSPPRSSSAQTLTLHSQHSYSRKVETKSDALGLGIPTASH